VPEPALGRPRNQESPSAAETLRAFVGSILRNVEPSAALVGFAESPPEHYTLELAIPGRASTSLILSKQLMEGVQTNPSAERALRHCLTSATLDPASPERRHVS
jgi:hypothetical protein